MIQKVEIYHITTQMQTDARKNSCNLAKNGLHSIWTTDSKLERSWMRSSYSFNIFSFGGVRYNYLQTRSRCAIATVLWLVLYFHPSFPPLLKLNRKKYVKCFTICPICICSLYTQIDNKTFTWTLNIHVLYSFEINLKSIYFPDQPACSVKLFKRLAKTRV